MRRQHAFGMAGGPGGVHDGRVVFWRNPKRIEVRFLQRFTAGYQVMNFRNCRFGSSRPHHYDVDAQLAEAGVYCLIAGGVGEDKSCPGVLEPIFKLWPGPPGIHGYNNRSEHSDRHIGEAPLWRIPATDSDAVPCLNAVLFLQLSRQFARGREGFAKAVSLRFIDQEILIGVSQSDAVQFAEVSGDFGEDREFMPINNGRANRKRGIWRFVGFDDIFQLPQVFKNFSVTQHGLLTQP